jgi:hypothetical protein
LLELVVNQKSARALGIRMAIVTADSILNCQRAVVERLPLQAEPGHRAYANIGNAQKPATFAEE